MSGLLDEKTGWQKTLLPFMSRSIAIMGLLFFLGSLMHVYLIHSELGAERIASASSIDVAGHDYQQALFALEHESMIRQSRIVNAVIMRQTSLLHIGFMTGMVLCLVGSIFVLGRLDIETTHIDGEAQGARFALGTSSPGILLVCFGCALMCLTLFHRFQFNLPDKVIYIQPSALPGGSEPPASASPGEDSIVPSSPPGKPDTEG